MRPKKDGIDTANGQKQRYFDECLAKLIRYSSKNNNNYPLQDNLVDACISLINKTNISPEQKKKNSSYIAGHFKGAFSKFYSKQSLVSVFEKISVWLDLDKEEKEQVLGVIKKYNIKCSDKCLKRFMPKPRNSFFDRVDNNPTPRTILDYAHHLFTRKPTKNTDSRNLFNLLDKYRAIYKPQASQISLFGQTTELFESGHKKMIASVLKLYAENSSLVDKKFLFTLMMQTNFNDKEVKSLTETFSDDKDVVLCACKKRRELDIKRLNSYLFNIGDKDKKDKLSLVSHRSVYVSLLYQSLIEGKDISDVDINKEYLKQKTHLKQTLFAQFKEALNDEGSERGKWIHAQNKVHKLIAKDDSLKIANIQKYIQSSPYINKASCDCMELDDNLHSLKGDNKSLHYYIKGPMSIFDL